MVHFEIEALDKDKLSQFYSDAFGWQMQKMGEDMGGYIVVTTGKPNDPADPGINGGIYQDAKKALNAYSCVIGVEDIDKAIAAVRAAGGKVEEHNMDGQGHDMGEKMDIPTIGIYAKCEDPEGNKFTLLQPSPDMMAAKPE